SFGDAFAKDLGLPVAVATAAMAIALFLVAEIAAKLIGRFLHKRMTGGFTKAVERGGGFLVGTGKGLLVAWVFASLIALLRPHRPTAGAGRAPSRETRGGPGAPASPPTAWASRVPGGLPNPCATFASMTSAGPCCSS